MPPVYKGAAGLETLWYRPGEENELAMYLDLGLGKDLGSPVIGIGALGVEGYVGARGSEFDGGARAMFSIPSFGFGIGADYNALDDRTDLLLRLDLPIKRGGVVGGGSMLSARWLPGRGGTFGVGLSVPTWGPNLGRTRARRDNVRMDDRKPQRLGAEHADSALAAPLAQLKERALWITRLSQPFAERTGGDIPRAVEPDLAVLLPHWTATDAAFPNGHTLNEEVRVYHETLDRAFSSAISGEGRTTTDAGRRVSARAREILLEEVLHPYNFTLGQRKGRDTLSGLGAIAQARFARWLLSSEVGMSRQQALNAFFVFQALCDAAEASRVELRERWEDSRLVYLPLQLGLKPEDHDTQDELDRIVSRASRAEFSEGNQVGYVLNEAFQWEFARSVQAAEDYHVLWIHDFRGQNGEGDPDRIAFLQVANYLRALTRRVRAYDETGKIPLYMIFLDQHYFEINRSRLWLRLLREPLTQKIELPPAQSAWGDSLMRLQDELRRAVQESQLLKTETSQFGEKWLANRIRIHVNITNPADPSFRSLHVAGIIPIPDNMMRDHRKIAFYDVCEEDPYKGAAVFTGMGIGEHYVGADWEDRAILLKGPEALDAKRAAYALLMAQGFDEDEVPFPLRPRPFPKSYDDRIQARLAADPQWLKHRGNVLQLHNQTGYMDKPIDPAKAALYALMPRGSVLKIPDSLWQNYLYASLLTGSALRGCRILVIAPSLASAPSSAAPTMARAHGLMSRLLAFTRGAEAQLEGEGGILKVGFYKPRQGVGDIAGRFSQAVGNAPSWIHRFEQVDPSVTEVARNAGAILDSVGYSVEYLMESDSLAYPKLHLKANFLASGDAWDGLIKRPEWAAVLRAYIVFLAEQKPQSRRSVEISRDGYYPEEVVSAVETLLHNYLAALSAEERDRIVLYLSVGSANMDYRSMVMDGEVMILLSKWSSIQGLLDFLLLAGMCEWPETQAELDALLPPPDGFTRTTAGLFKLSL